MSELENNPHFMEGKFMGRRMLKHIESTTYGSIEVAIQKKQELVDDFKEHFGWDETHKEVAFNMGLIAGLKTGLEDDNRAETDSVSGDS